MLLGGWIFAAHPGGNQITGTLVTGAGVLAADQIAFGGGMEALVLDTLAQATSPSYKNRLQLHEAAHFLVAYLMGILPKGYTLSSLDAYDKYGALNVQARVPCPYPFVHSFTQHNTSSAAAAAAAAAAACPKRVLFPIPFHVSRLSPPVPATKIRLLFFKPLHLNVVISPI